MRFVFVMDPLDRVTHDKDTTFAFIQAAQKRGHASLHALLRDLYIRDGEAWAAVTPVEVLPEAPWIVLHRDKATRICLNEVDAVFMRKDPPFDRAYLYATLVLERARGKTLLINDPRGLRDANEKLYALNFPAWTPRTMVTSNRDLIHEFCREVGGSAMVKPLDGAGGMGVLQIKTGDKNARGIADMLTGPVGLATSTDPVAAAKVAIEFAKTNDKLEIVGGSMGTQLLDAEGVKALASLPSLDELRGKIVGLLQAPATKLATVIQAPASQLARVFNAYAEKDAA